MKDKVQEIVSTATKPKTLVEGLDYNKNEILRRIKLYMNDQFLVPKTNAVFWNISKPRSPYFVKNIDLDTKDLIPYGVGETNFVQNWALKQKFYKFAREKKLALDLNTLITHVADYGSALLKLCKKDGKYYTETVDPINIYLSEEVSDIRDTETVELHSLSRFELERKKEVWDEEKVNKILEIQKEGPYEIWEFWGFVDNEYKNQIGFGYGEKKIVLVDEKEDIKNNPYYDFHVSEFQGRWLRVGVYERLFHLQVRINELVNQNAQSTAIASLLLLRTANPEFSGNVLEQAESGDILASPDLQQISIDNRSINSFISEMRLIEEQADKLCLTPQYATGDAPPSGTPFRSLALTTNVNRSAFLMIKQSIGEKVGYLMIDKILPSLAAEWKSEDILDIAEFDQDIGIYDQSIKAKVTRDFFVENLLNGRIVSQEEIQTVMAQVDQSFQVNGRKLKIPKGYFNFDYGIRVNVTGESVDKQQKNDASFNALQMVQANPAIVNIPLFKQYLEDNGINYWRLTPTQIEEIKQGATNAKPIDAQTDKLMAQVNS